MAFFYKLSSAQGIVAMATVPFMAFAFLIPIVYLNTLLGTFCESLADDKSISYTQKCNFNQLCREFPVYFGVCGVNFDVKIVSSIMLSALVPAGTKLGQYLYDLSQHN